MNKANILVVDDRPEGLLAVQAVLDSSLYNVITASSGNEALRHLLNNDFAVILLDVQMPVMNGFETASIIKTREKSKDIPIIFMSAINQDEQYVYQGYGVGAIDYLLKPFDPYILRSKVAIFVDIWKKKKLIQEQAARLRENEKKLHAQELDRVEFEGLRRYQILADSIPHMVFRVNKEGQITYHNKVLMDYTGLPERTIAHINWKEIIHRDDTEKFNLAEDRYTEEVEIEARVLNRTGEFKWHLIRFEPEFMLEDSTIQSWLGTATDIEERKREEMSQKFLSEAGELLVSTLNPHEVLDKIAKAAIPFIADWCAFDLIDDKEGCENVIIHHRDPRELEKTRTLHKNFLMSEGKRPCMERLLSGKERFVLNATLEGSFISFPMLHKNKILGVMTFANTVSQRKFGDKETILLEELARRIALALENAYLYRVSQMAIEARNDFLSIASHELNTPITSLKLQLQMMKKAMSLTPEVSAACEKFQKSVDSSVKQVNRLINLVQILLDVTRIQSGKFAFKFTEFSASELVTEVVERHHELLNSSDCNIKVSVDTDVKVAWDRTRIDQVITNLLTNAIKYAPGKIDLEMKDTGDMVMISIRDYGKGIPSKKMESIFNRFERAHNQETVTGLGLGLFIVKQIVEGHSGKVDVESKTNQGTIFRIMLPKRPVDPSYVGLQPSFH